jgi:hypothetical protein
MKDSAASSPADVIEDEAASIDRDLADVLMRIMEKGLKTEQEVTEREIAELEEAISRARLRVIALARSRGWLWRLMRPYDEPIGDNVVRFRRRVR